MPPVLVLEPTPLEAVAVAPGKLLVFDEALALVEHASADGASRCSCGGTDTRASCPADSGRKGR
jgi:hypothetical protein